MDSRKLKRWSRESCSATYYAYVAGQYDAEMHRPYRNRFPAGLRHDEYDRGYRTYDCRTHFASY